MSATTGSAQFPTGPTTPTGTVAGGPFVRQADRVTKPGVVVLLTSDAQMPVVHVLDGVVADYNRPAGQHHTADTESLAAAILCAIQDWQPAMVADQPTSAAKHRTKLHYQLFSDAYSASCSCGWRASSCTDRERIVRFKMEHEQEHADG